MKRSVISPLFLMLLVSVFCICGIGELQAKSKCKDPERPMGPSTYTIDNTSRFIVGLRNLGSGKYICHSSCVKSFGPICMKRRYSLDFQRGPMIDADNIPHHTAVSGHLKNDFGFDGFRLLNYETERNSSIYINFYGREYSGKVQSIASMVSGATQFLAEFRLGSGEVIQLRITRRLDGIVIDEVGAP